MIVSDDGCMDVNGVLGNEAVYKYFCVTVNRMFERTGMNVNCINI